MVKIEQTLLALGCISPSVVVHELAPVLYAQFNIFSFGEQVHNADFEGEILREPIYVADHTHSVGLRRLVSIH